MLLLHWLLLLPLVLLSLLFTLFLPLLLLQLLICWLSRSFAGDILLLLFGITLCPLSSLSQSIHPDY